MSRRYVLCEDGAWRAPGANPIGAVPDPGIPTTPTPDLAFDMPTREVVASLDRKCWGHAFVTFPYGGDGRANQGLTWYRNRQPGGTMNTEYGGELRDNPVEIAGVTRPRTEPNWWILDRAEEVRIARDAGWAGLTVDWLNLNDGTGDNRTGQVREYALAIRYLGVQDDFKLILMPDGTTSICDGGNFTAFVNKTIALLTDYPDVFYRDTDGKWIIAPYFPEGAPNSKPGDSRITNTSASATATYWSNYISALATAGFQVKLWMCYVRSWSTDATTANALSSIGVMNSRWGDRDYVSSGSASVNNGGAPAKSHAPIESGGYNRPWMHPVSNQDNRCNTSESPKAWEPGNTRNLTATWGVAINGPAEQVQIPTWSDQREHAHMMPSENHGYAWLDLSAYYWYKWAIGEWPTIQRDVVYLSHNLHRMDDFRPTGTQKLRMIPSNSTAWVSDVEAHALLTSIANTTVEINVNGSITTFVPGASNQVMPGSSAYRFRVSMPSTGTVSTTVKRNGLVVTSVTSPFTITKTPVGQDKHLRMVGSIRGA